MKAFWSGHAGLIELLLVELLVLCLAGYEWWAVRRALRKPRSARGRDAAPHKEDPAAAEAAARTPPRELP